MDLVQTPLFKWRIKQRKFFFYRKKQDTNKSFRYYNLYGRTECTYEPAMTKAFAHGRTEAIRTVTPEVVKFVQTFNSDVSASEKITTLRAACDYHSKLSKDCSKGLGHDR